MAPPRPAARCCTCATAARPARETALSFTQFIALDMSLLQPFIKRSDLQSSGALRPDTKHREDTAFYNACFRHGVHFVLFPEPLYCYRVREGAMSTNYTDVERATEYQLTEYMQMPEVRADARVMRLLRQRLARIQWNLEHEEIVGLLRNREYKALLRCLACDWRLALPFAAFAIRAVRAQLASRRIQHSLPVAQHTAAMEETMTS